MQASDSLRAALGDALRGVEPGLATANRLCDACVELLEVDGAAISMVVDGSTRGTFGSSGPVSRELDEYQFTFGEGPCLDAVAAGHPVFADDLDDRYEQRWPAFSGAALQAGVHGVFAFPVFIAASSVGALDLFRERPAALSATTLEGSLMAAQLAMLPLLDLAAGLTGLASEDLDGAAQDVWGQVASLDRVEVYQATGMLIAQLEVDAAEALVRLRGHAFATGQTASQVAWAIVERRLTLEPDRRWPRDGDSRTDAP